MRLVSGARRGPPPSGGVWIGADLASRLALTTGSRVTFGEKTFRVDGVIADEPDRLGEGFTLGPVAIIGMDDLPATRLIQPGSLYQSKYRVRLPAGADPAAVGKRLTADFPDEIGRASCRERVCQYVQISVVAVTLKKQTHALKYQKHKNTNQLN